MDAVHARIPSRAQAGSGGAAGLKVGLWNCTLQPGVPPRPDKCTPT